MIQEPRFKDNASRVIHRAEVDAVVSGWIALYTRAEALQAFTDAGVGARGRYRRVNGRSPRGRARHFDALPDAEHWRSDVSIDIRYLRWLLSGFRVLCS